MSRSSLYMRIYIGNEFLNIQDRNRKRALTTRKLTVQLDFFTRSIRNPVEAREKKSAAPRKPAWSCQRCESGSFWGNYSACKLGHVGMLMALGKRGPTIYLTDYIFPNSVEVVASIFRQPSVVEASSPGASFLFAVLFKCTMLKKRHILGI